MPMGDEASCCAEAYNINLDMTIVKENSSVTKAPYELTNLAKAIGTTSNPSGPCLLQSMSDLSEESIA